jgi:hypothetical protein
MRITCHSLGNLNADPFKITVLEANTYIPLYGVHTFYKEEDITFYSRPLMQMTTGGSIKKPNTLKNIKDALEMAITPRRILIGNKNYYFIKGAMYTEDGNPLMVLGMSKEAFKNPDIPNFSDNYGESVSLFDYKNFVMFYSTSFFTEPSLAPLNRRFQKEILMSCYEKGIEVRVITSSEIEKNTFANIFEIPKVNSVDQLEEYMNKVLPTILYTKEEDTFVFEELTVPEIVQDHELSVEEEALLFDSETSQELPGINPTTFDITLNTEEEEETLEDFPFYVDPEIEEMEREAATWESAHTNYQLEMPAPASQTAQSSFVERVMNTFNNLVITGESVVHADYAIDYAIANAEAAITAHVQQTMRNNRPIELIDDTE